MTLPFVLFGFSADLKDEEAVKKLTIKPGTKSKLPKPVQELVGMIFDVESMKKALVEYEVGAEPGGFSHPCLPGITLSCGASSGLYRAGPGPRPPLPSLSCFCVT